MHGRGNLLNQIIFNGFFLRWTYNDFFDRYRMLIPWKKINWDSLNDTCNTILSSHIEVIFLFFYIFFIYPFWYTTIVTNTWHRNSYLGDVQMLVSYQIIIWYLTLGIGNYPIPTYRRAYSTLWNESCLILISSKF